MSEVPVEVQQVRVHYGNQIHFDECTWSIPDGTDYTSVSEVLTFQPGDTSATVQVSALTDGVDEDRETMSLTLSDPTNSVLGAATTATVNIDDTNSKLIFCCCCCFSNCLYFPTFRVSFGCFFFLITLKFMQCFYSNYSNKQSRYHFLHKFSALGDLTV